MRVLLIILSFIMVFQYAYAAETAKTQKYGIEQQKEPVRSDIARICDQWTSARKSACKRFSEQLKQQYNLTTPFPLLEERTQSELRYRIATEGVQLKQNELMLVCEKDTVQDPYRLTGIDDISVQEPKEKKLSPESVRLSSDGAVAKTVSKAEQKRKAQSYVLLADGESDVQGKKGCMLEKDVQKKYGKGCAKPKGDGGSKEDPKTCTTGLTKLKGVPFSDESIQSIRSAGIQCFKEERGRVKKNQKTEIAEKISLASYVLCSDDADALKRATEADRKKKDNNPDADAIEDMLAGESVPQYSVRQSSAEHRTNVSALIREYLTSKENTKILQDILEESKEFGRAFLQEATKKEVAERIQDYKEQLARGAESRGHMAALYGGLCGLGEVQYCKTKIRQDK